ncbi:hypothetical protein GCM10023311_08240 [Flaviramulus aquimarinus]|uniref:DUF4919 domain-containing protein n=1 Tax=Flaviramulus aquimarinus TaxID=1170456 RepID=A0ABP9ETJ1_9FLAO
MRTVFFKLLIITLAFSIVSCKKENTFTDYKYADGPAVITCEGLNSKLYQEALYAFENDILTYHKKINTSTTLVQAYSRVMRASIYGQLKLEEIISAHTVKVFKALKNENDLWVEGNPKSRLNYNSIIVNCISKNIMDKALNTTFNALISTNSMSPKLFGSPLMSKFTRTSNDKYLATYIALDLFYAKLFDVDLSKINFDKKEPLEDFDVILKKPEADPHAGHNH